MISIVIPVYNRELFIDRALESVKNQTLSDWELIIVDDCSTDNSYSVIKRHLNDHRIKYFKLSNNKGAAAARNFGIKQALGEYISLLDSDDVYHKDFLFESLNSISRISSCYGFTYVATSEIDKFHKGPPVSKEAWVLPAALNKIDNPYFYSLGIGTAAGLTIRKEYFSEIGFFDESLKAAEDTDLLIRGCKKYLGKPIHKELVFRDFSSNGRLTRNYTKNKEAYRIIIDKYKETIFASPSLILKWYYKLMWLSFYCGDKRSAFSSYNVIKKSGCLNLNVKLVYILGMISPTTYFIWLHKKLAS